jgi:hypothetical protein
MAAMALYFSTYAPRRPPSSLPATTSAPYATHGISVIATAQLARTEGKEAGDHLPIIQTVE